VAPPTGPQLAGKHGVGLLQIGATPAAGFDSLALHWDVMETQAAHDKTQVSRHKWRLVGTVLCAETMDQAYRDVESRMPRWFGPSLEPEPQRHRGQPDAGRQLGRLRRHAQELRPDRAPRLPALAGPDVTQDTADRAARPELADIHTKAVEAATQHDRAKVAARAGPSAASILACGQPHGQAVEIIVEHQLARQATVGLAWRGGEFEHRCFVDRGPCQSLEPGRIDEDMTSGAGQQAAAIGSDLVHPGVHGRLHQGLPATARDAQRAAIGRAQVDRDVHGGAGLQ
jgi:hypothetical protein